MAANDSLFVAKRLQVMRWHEHNLLAFSASDPKRVCGWTIDDEERNRQERELFELRKSGSLGLIGVFAKTFVAEGQLIQYPGLVMDNRAERAFQRLYECPTIFTFTEGEDIGLNGFHIFGNPCRMGPSINHSKNPEECNVEIVVDREIWESTEETEMAKVKGVSSVAVHFRVTRDLDPNEELWVFYGKKHFRKEKGRVWCDACFKCDATDLVPLEEDRFRHAQCFDTNQTTSPRDRRDLERLNMFRVSKAAEAASSSAAAAHRPSMQLPSLPELPTNAPSAVAAAAAATEPSLLMLHSPVLQQPLSPVQSVFSLARPPPRPPAAAAAAAASYQTEEEAREILRQKYPKAQQSLLSVKRKEYNDGFEQGKQTGFDLGKGEGIKQVEQAAGAWVAAYKISIDEKWNQAIADNAALRREKAELQQQLEEARRDPIREQLADARMHIEQLALERDQLRAQLQQLQNQISNPAQPPYVPLQHAMAGAQHPLSQSSEFMQQYQGLDLPFM